MLASAVPAGAQEAPFCVVSAAGMQCLYYDAPTCRQMAAAVRGACVVRVPRDAAAPSVPNLGGAVEGLGPENLERWQRLRQAQQEQADRELARRLVPLVYGATARTREELVAAVGGPEKFAALMRTPEGRAAIDCPGGWAVAL